MSAASIANAIDRRSDVWRKREDEYLAIAKQYEKDELKAIVQLFKLTTLALEFNPEQDFLGRLYMQFGIANNWRGQFFTPLSVSDLMARLVIGPYTPDQIREHGYISVNDSSCGAGCMMIAFANYCLSQGINYQQSVLFVGQDIDPVVGRMCYIQTSLLGCPGYVVIGNTITEPTGGTLLNPEFKRPEDIWFTPLYFSKVWAVRRATESLMQMLGQPQRERHPTELKKFLKGKRHE